MSKLLFCSFFLLSLVSAAQIDVSINAVLNEAEKTLQIEQKIVYQNTSENTLNFIYLNDWAHSFSSKNTPLAERFAEDYQRNFHFAKPEERGSTTIDFINSENQELVWARTTGHPDIVRVKLKKPLPPGKTVELYLQYVVKIPADKFTRYGHENLSDRQAGGNFKLRYWFLSPAVYSDGWQTYSNKNLGDLFVPKTNFKISINVPADYQVVSPLNMKSAEYRTLRKTILLEGKNRTDTRLYLLKKNLPPFERINTNQFQVITNLKDGKLALGMKQFLVGRIAIFLEKRLGKYPFEKILITQEDYLENPVYGLNQLPSFIRPFPDGFQYDIKQLKTITSTYLENTLLLNPRTEKWIIDAIQIKLMMDYVDRYYPDMKLLGSLADFFAIEWFHAADLEFNDQYAFLFMHMARMNLDQALSTPQDSLIKFNENISNTYKAGVGLNYLENFLENDETIQKSIKEFYQKYRLEPISASDFEQTLKKNARKNIAWFFQDYVGTNKKIDFTIDDVRKTEDSLYVTIKNKTEANVPIPLYGLSDGKVVSKKWVENVGEKKTVQIPRKNIDRVGLNYEQIVPEFNQRDNYHRVTTLFNKPFQFRLLLDAQDPRYNQAFLIPEFSYNLYDGIAIGPKLHNKTLLRKNFNYDISPKFGFKSRSLIGSLSIYNIDQYKNQKLHAITYGFGGTRYSYAKDLYYYKLTPFLTLSFRNPNLRNNEAQSLSLRSVNVIRDEGIEKLQDDPDYSVFNIRYGYSNQNMVDYFTATADYQVAKEFSKFAVTATYRKLFRNNRQINLRLFAGTFIFNESRETDFFSFALDRPSDYLFDYNYYGRSESSGLFSQQFIRAEGGFKSQLQPAYANQWITTLNASTNLWKWIYVYGDVGLVKNTGVSPQFVYDSGIRMSFVQDYFELFFPVYSNLGWEIDQPNYDQKIRFIVSLDISTLIKLFTREWY
ncbi:MAG TPA: metalloprotease [Flavobacteriaceae bacterium]|nr:metalloprotease [Flavobacteriaceae bacterium]